MLMRLSRLQASEENQKLLKSGLGINLSNRMISVYPRYITFSSIRTYMQCNKEDKSINMTPSSHPMKVDESIQNTTISNFMDKEELGL